MRELPILFQPNLARAALDGYKSQTRRTTGLKSFNITPDEWTARFWDGFAYFRRAGHAGEIEVRCPYGKPGDRLWVRERWQGPLWDGDWHNKPADAESPAYCRYAADGGPTPEFIDGDDNLRQGWRSSLHMPRWACRLLLDVKRIRIERLHACTEADALAEGIALPGMEIAMGSARGGFRNLWNGINGEGSWDANPWVWAIEFEKAKQ